MNLTHWNYFIAIDNDISVLSRYIEFNEQNMSAHSIEIARLLMSSTQEIDVLLKSICKRHNSPAENEKSYREFIPTIYNNFTSIEVHLPLYNISLAPFGEWKENKTPSWWTANNKVKHHRDTHFNHASLENLLLSGAGLYVLNVYYYAKEMNEPFLIPQCKNFYSESFGGSLTPTIFGMVSLLKVPD